MLVDDIREVQELMAKGDIDWDTPEGEKVADMQLRFASLLPSPSKMNAVGVLSSNSAERLVEFLLANEAPIFAAKEESTYADFKNQSYGDM